MRQWKFALCSTSLLAGAAFSAPATLPATTQPNDSAPNVQAVTPIERQTILILPFSESAGSNFPWHAFQHDLLTDISRATRAQVIAPASRPPAGDVGQAVQIGREENASLVIYGQYQIVGQQVRITAQVIDVKTEKPGGAFTAIGSATNLFPVEDSISLQILRALPPGWLIVSLPPNPSVANNQPVPPPTITPTANPPLQQYYSYTYPDNAAGNAAYPDYYDGGYPYYGYGAPYYGPDLWFYGGWGYYHRHYGDHGYYGHGFDHSFGSHGFGHASVGSHSGGGSHGGGGHSGGGGHR